MGVFGDAFWCGVPDQARRSCRREKFTLSSTTMQPISCAYSISNPGILMVQSADSHRLRTLQKRSRQLNIPGTLSADLPIEAREVSFSHPLWLLWLRIPRRRSGVLKAMPVASASGWSTDIVHVADGCGQGRYRVPGGACHRFGRRPNPRNATTLVSSPTSSPPFICNGYCSAGLSLSS